MVNINLLPPLQKQHVKHLIASLIGLFLIGIIHWHFKQLIAEKEQKIIALNQEIRAIESEILTRSPHVARLLKPIKPLFDFLQQMPATLPIGLYLTDLKLQNNALKLIGHAEGFNIIADWVNRLKQLPIKVSIRELNASKNTPDFPLKFFLDVVFLRPDAHSCSNLPG